MKHRHLAAVVLAAAALAGCQAQNTREFGPAIDSRFIPIALWAGADWDGVHAVRPVAVDTTSASADRSIRGPLPWTHPVTGATLQVYERQRRQADGVKRQLYAVRADSTALGRVHDSRPGASDRLFDGEAIFPLGAWRAGEIRDYRYVEYGDGEPAQRVATIRIRRLDFTNQGLRHSLKYDWSLCDGEGRVLFDERYVYSPSRGLVEFEDRTAEAARGDRRADCQDAGQRPAA